ncbi:YesL family protein [Paenibacillus sp. FSL R7-0179]|uniref:YesL family protein n=1 Tax=Paenibacillus sp. FSL R7-0179 TaxID=2921672 RepID=UPI0030F9557D
MEFKGAMGGIYRITEWISRIAFSNILWALCSIPFLFAGILKILMLGSEAGGPNEQIMLNWVLGIFAPFTVFPATSALFTVVRKWVMGNTDVSTFRTFFQGYKENYLKSMLGGLIYTLLFVVMYVDVTVYMTQMPNFKIVGILMLVLMIILFVSMFNFFSIVVHYQMTFKEVVTNSILLTIARPIRVFSTLIGSGVLLYIGLRYPVLYVICIPTLVAMLAFFNFFATYNKLQLQVEKKKLAEEQAALEAAENEGLASDDDDDEDDEDEDEDDRDKDTGKDFKRT